MRGSDATLTRRENGKLTDGELTNCIASLHDSAREPAVAIGHSAGWIVNGLHTYGGHPRTALEIHNPFFTSLSNLYMEGFDEAGLSINGVQTSVSVSNLHIIALRPERRLHQAFRPWSLRDLDGASEQHWAMERRLEPR